MGDPVCYCNPPCGLPPCAECNEDHGGLRLEGRGLCRDCWQEATWKRIAEHEEKHPGSLARRLEELGRLLSERKAER